MPSTIIFRTQRRFGGMFSLQHFLLLFFLLLYTPAVICCAHAQATAAPPEAGRPTLTRRIDGIAFSRGAHGDLLSDIYLPTTSGVRPAVVYIHGGGWKSGDRSQLHNIATALADAGYVGMAIDYDLTTQGDRFPMALHEAEAAVSWLRTHAMTYDVDPARIAVLGSSAGGELAALLALDLSAGKQVKAAVVLNGVLDLSYVGPDAGEMVVPYLGGSCEERPVLCRQASPVAVVHADAPPFFVGHGTADRIVPYSQAVSFIARLQAGAVPVTVFIADGGPHTYWNASQWMESNIAAVRKFLNTAMPSPTEPGHISQR